MYKVLLFAGTVEGRIIAEFLNDAGIPARVCVATEYGESLLPEGNFLEVSHQRFTEEEMEELMLRMEDGVVIDATHPYAQLVTENIQQACIHTGTAYLRVLRKETVLNDESDGVISETNDEGCPVVYARGIREAVEYLQETSGNILVTTGSKELSAFTALTDYQNRVFARVLSLVEVVKSCAALGLEGKHLICMQGPFSREMNCAMIRQVNASWMVTKESGTAGGFMEKYLAAKETGCGLVIVGRPKKEEGVSLEECLEYLRNRWNLQQEHKTHQTEREISIVGIGMGTSGTLTREAQKALENAQLLVGAGRMLQQIGKSHQKQFISYKPEEICDYLENHPEYQRIAVAMSGDVGFYSGAKKLLDLLNQRMPDSSRKIYCGISSMIYFCGRLETSWDDVLPVSLHGRKRNVVGLLQQCPKIFLIVGSADGVAQLCRKLTEYGMGDVQVSVGERLSYPDEKITRGCAEEMQDIVTDPLSVMLLERTMLENPVLTPGINDELFIRGKVPMTKEEVRSVSLSKLRLTGNAVVYDVGAGTGSVSVEMARIALEGQVFAVEKKPEAVELIADNKKKFCVDNLEIIEGTAPEAIRDLPAPTHAFIGGSSGNLKEILQLIREKNPEVRIVINCITLETVAEALECLKHDSFRDVDIAQISVSKGKTAGPYHLMMGQNPVYIISCTGAKQDE